MNIEQRASVIEILQNDCQITGVFINNQGETCAVGALAKAAGITDDYLHYHAGVLDSQKLCRAIKEKFGLSRQQLLEIQSTNDSAPIMITNAKRLVVRRRWVIDLIDSFSLDS